MAHIPDGVLSAPVLISGALVSTGLLGVALRRLREAELPQAAVLAAAFFVASLISVPLGPSSVHLLLNGLMGLLLGWAAVPAIFVALLLQAVFFGFGGLLVLGVNTLNLALPALLVARLLRPMLQRMAELSSPQQRRALMIGGTAGVLAVLLTGLMLAASLVLSGEAFWPAARVIVLSFIPLALIEGLVTGIVVAFLLRVEPALLRLDGGRHGA
ncbi:cobalt transporter CbiM [Halochromatium salexigens]|uniref:Cobalamin biosynthesis protein CbiM n=1 Tax=Halochromatium salexigens TaxID=49447 RepID=A0AAJ0UIG2_HALSE|nr:cobalt transporter CbiM [Halochromatium salexigens]MBK5932089.1 cobalamin biosynthesis protein CbiM [Halochromatium salexigens]